MEKQNLKGTNPPPAPHEFPENLKGFEDFFYTIGFKRIDGAIYGLLILSQISLSSEDIEKALGISQSAISVSLKKLHHFGAIETRDSREKRVKLHTAKEDSLEVVATLFKKREQENIQNFKKMAEKLLYNNPDFSLSPKDPRYKKIKSIILTCELAESVIKFVVNLSNLQIPKDYPVVVQKLPLALDLISQSAQPLVSFTTQIKSTWADKLKGGLSRFSGDH
jgi:DNA-binding transcriptional regulator GbsR (MarR family)